MSKVKTTYMSEQEVKELEEECNFRPPSAFYIRNALNDYIFYHCRNRGDAQKACNEEFGQGKYLIKASRMGKKPDQVTAK